MARVICTLPNAGPEIGGRTGLVRFTREGEAWVSEDISPEEAERFCSIPGYTPAPAAGHDETAPRRGSRGK